MSCGDWVSLRSRTWVIEVQMVPSERGDGMMITKEEFGHDLYEAIATCASAQHALAMIAVDVHRGKNTTDLAAQYGRLKTEAKKLVAHADFSDEDAARLMRQYPWLGH